MKLIEILQKFILIYMKNVKLILTFCFNYIKKIPSYFILLKIIDKKTLKCYNDNTLIVKGDC